MAKIYRGAASDKTTSPAEVELLKGFERLPDTYTVIHSVPWQGHRSAPTITEGETDFLVLHPVHGLLMIEVKGGIITTERREVKNKVEVAWFTTPRNQSGTKIPIHDPCQQADRSRRNLMDWFANDQRTKAFLWKDNIYHAVILPDCEVSRDLRPDCPREVFIDFTDVDSLSKRIGEIFNYWVTKYPAKFGGQPAIDAVIDLLMPKADLTPSLAAAFQREGKQIERLTEEQYDVLLNLRFHNKEAIVGGAGTGKTILAMEKTRRLVDREKKRVLFLCYNRNLSRWIGEKLNDEKEALLEVLTFHQLVERYLRRANIDRSKLTEEEFLNKAADLLDDALKQIKKKPTAQMDLYDAIIVDEAQDFRDEWWIPLPDLLKDAETGIMYLFFDDNQRIYTQLSNIPFKSQGYSLARNCRNTQGIFTALKRYLPSSDLTYCVGPEGRAIEMLPGEDKKQAQDSLETVLTRLTREGVAAADILVLTPVRKGHSMWKDGEKVGKFELTWALDDDDKQTTSPLGITLPATKVRISTVHSFKGLESAVVILTEMDKAYDEVIDQLAYVALSRARNHVVVIGKLPEPKKVSS